MEDNNSEEKRPFAGCHWHGKGGGHESALFAKSLVSIHPQTNNIDRPTKHSLPLTQLTNLPLSGKWGGFVD